MAPLTAAATRALDFARSKLGTLEEPVNRCEFNRWYYGRDVGAAWCATFASNCMYVGAGFAPVPASTAKGFAYVPSGVDWAKRNGVWLPNQPGKWVGSPGMLSVFSFGKQRPDHIEHLEALGPKPGQYIDIGGNTLKPGAGGDDRSGGGVWRRLRESSLIGFIDVPWPTDPQPIPPADDEDETDMAKIDPTAVIYIPTDDAGSAWDPKGVPYAPPMLVRGITFMYLLAQAEVDQEEAQGVRKINAKPFSIDAVKRACTELKRG